MKYARIRILRLTWVFCCLAAIARADEPGLPMPLREWQNEQYRVLLFDPYSKNSGLIQLFYRGIPLLRGENTFANIQVIGEKILLRAVPQEKYFTTPAGDGNRLIWQAMKNLPSPENPGKACATIDKSIHFDDVGFSINGTLTALETLEFNGYERTPYREQFSISAEATKDWVLEGTTLLDENVMAKIPFPYNNEHWALGNLFFRELRFSGNGVCFLLEAGEGTSIRIIYYEGAHGLEIYLGSLYQASGETFQLKPGESFQVSCKMQFKGDTR